MAALASAFEEAHVPLRRIAKRLGLTSAGGISSLVARCRKVITTDPEIRARPVQFIDLVDALPAAFDLLVYTPEEFNRGMAKGFGIFDIIKREGRLL